MKNAAAIVRIIITLFLISGETLEDSTLYYETLHTQKMEMPEAVIHQRVEKKAVQRTRKRAEITTTAYFMAPALARKSAPRDVDQSNHRFLYLRQFRI